MAHAQSKSNNDYSYATVAATSDDQQKLTATFHDFLGAKGQNPFPPAGEGGQPSSEVSPSASASLGASSCGGRGPMSTTSDLYSEKHVGSHLEGIPFYQSRGEFKGLETSNRFIGTKRSNSDSFMVSSKEKFPQLQPDESSHLMKLLRHAGGDRPRWPHDEETSFVMHQMRPISASLITQSSSDGDSKWDRPIPVNLGSSSQYPPRAGQVAPFGYQTLSNRFKDTNPGPAAISRTAADEGSRTGIKGSGILSSINATIGVSERLSSGVLIHTDKQKSGAYIAEPESATPSQHRIESASFQMTIFYGGQAHVFDKVHPNKADFIMALARSSGESWSTTFAPKSASGSLTGDNCIPGDASIATPKELHERTSDGGKSHHGFGSGSRSGGS
ncbi:protein TIFY 8-like isoform X1 [Olea europaea var. sylvestris]|uniref:protein TIFY 8-like isoform X1 n=1 Tax=Olea europaea var. sylvestris TaxID=158386 RepID=UPI000C1CE3B0|nr:protein TIFY 8-like isoform X1 [Olea europaea var. sylvestris]